MPRKSIHIRHNQCFSSFPCFSAYAPSFLYPRTSHRTLKRSKYQLLTFYQIKSYPEETESLLQRCCNVGKIGIRSFSSAIKHLICGSNVRYFSSLLPLLIHRSSAIVHLIKSYLLPKYRKNIPINTKIRSTALLFKFFSRKNRAPNKNETTTLPRRTIETIDIMESS